MNFVDIAIVFLLVLATLGGLRQGFILQIATILGAVFALLIANKEYLDLRHILVQFISGSRWLTVIAYLLIFLFVWAAVIVLARRLRGLARLLMLGWMDRVGGAVIGLLQGVLLVEVLITLGLKVPNHNLHDAIQRSAIGPSFQSVVPYVDRWFPKATCYRDVFKCE